ncbi:MAG: 4Fe-4S dicluster domain-containing protein, partial [Candidatus Aureabacteria bacterium]|nr:4Fe-4S dicluster domain-containing protein [Candidatus Auribacterota bacterium]
SAMLTGAVFLALILPNLLYPRFWCRFLCPLGALLGLTARCAPLAMRKGQIGCMLCGKCLVICQGGGSPEAGTPWRKSECLLCMNCQGACPGDLLGFEWLGISDAIEPVPDLTRRGVILSIGAGLCTLPLARLLRRPGRGIIRPPGSLPEGDFLAACLRCGTCTRICPTSAIHPSILEAGISGFWAPRLIPRIGYCVYSCTLCGQVCPSHAIGRLSLEEKMGSARMRPWKLGTAVVDRARCIPWAKGMQCIACEEVCPVSPKAVRVDEAKVTGPEGFAIMLGRPVIDQIACIGCGHCEHVCPVEGPAAIRVYGTRD